jgi:hypothetical protein
MKRRRSRVSPLSDLVTGVAATELQRLRNQLSQTEYDLELRKSDIAQRDTQILGFLEERMLLHEDRARLIAALEVLTRLSASPQITRRSYGQS